MLIFCKIVPSPSKQEFNTYSKTFFPIVEKKKEKKILPFFYMVKHYAPYFVQYSPFSQILKSFSLGNKLHRTKSEELKEVLHFCILTKTAHQKINWH